MARDYMIDYRYAHMLPLRDMAARCRVSVYLLTHLEQYDGYVTHPAIARRVAEAYKLTEDQLNTMLPPNYRPGKGYNPDKYLLDNPILMPRVKRMTAPENLKEVYNNGQLDGCYRFPG